MKQYIVEKSKLILLNLLRDSLDIVKEGYKLYPSIYKYINKECKKCNINIYTTQSRLYRLKEQKYIKIFRDNKKKIIQLTPIGRKKALKYALEYYQIKTPKKWNKKWQVIIFDIPEEKQNIRKAVRTKLRSCGFYQLQKSVWIHPFDCKDLIWCLKYIYSIDKYLIYMVVETLETEIDLISHFINNKILDENSLQ